MCVSLSYLVSVTVIYNFCCFSACFRGFIRLGFFDRQVQQFLRYVKDIYKKLPAFLPKIFEQRGQMKVHDLTEVNVEAALEETFTTTTILTEKRNTENQPISVGSRSAVVNVTLPVETAYLSSPPIPRPRPMRISVE